MISWLAIGVAFWLGVLTALSPCPLASNIAAMAFIGRELGSARRVLLMGVLYALGRMAAYVAVGALVMAGLTASGEVSRFLQRYLNQVLGPALIVAGMLLLGLLGAGGSFSLVGAWVQRRAARGGAWWALLLGMLFALSFCPVSAGLFFGGLIPLAVSHGSWLMLPGIFGVGTALPVIALAFVAAFASQRVGGIFNRLTRVEQWARTGAGVVFILAGLYYSLAYVYGVSFSP